MNKTELIYLSDSDDSDTEGGLGNVERVVMRPPGHSGKAKRGHLCFDSSFETGKGPFTYYVRTCRGGTVL